MKPRLRRWIPILLIAGGIGTFIFWPRRELVPYTTPPLDSKGTRLRLLVPRGWSLSWVNPGDHFCNVMIQPTVEKSWLPAWAEKVLDRRGNTWSQIELNWTHYASESYDRIILDGPEANRQRKI